MAAYEAFVYMPPLSRTPRMYWKMSIDLSRPLVLSMGHHDPLDGYVTSIQLQTTAAKFQGEVSGPELRDQVAGFAKLIELRGLPTVDPLGIGSLLIDASCVVQLMEEGADLE